VPDADVDAPPEVEAVDPDALVVPAEAE
jgi:hypothetical protein